MQQPLFAVLHHTISPHFISDLEGRVAQPDLCLLVIVCGKVLSLVVAETSLHVMAYGSVAYVACNPHTLLDNFSAPYPTVDVAGEIRAVRRSRHEQSPDGLFVYENDCGVRSAVSSSLLSTLV
jgi:hypothetical protein